MLELCHVLANRRADLRPGPRDDHDLPISGGVERVLSRAHLHPQRRAADHPARSPGILLRVLRQLGPPLRSAGNRDDSRGCRVHLDATAIHPGSDGRCSQGVRRLVENRSERFCINGATTMPYSLIEDIQAAGAAGFEAVEIWHRKLLAYLEGRSAADLRTLLQVNHLAVAAIC